MARPPKNAEGPSATERMETAFWSCLKTMPFNEITVRDIVTRAEVNRNSYYYHYDSMWDLARESIEHAKLDDLAHVLLGDTSLPAKNADDDRLEASYDHLRTLAGENSTQRLLDDAKQQIAQAWLEEFKLDPDSLDGSVSLAVNYTFGGVTALLASPEFDSLSKFMEQLGQSHLLSENVRLLREELDPNLTPQTGRSGDVTVRKTEQTVVIEASVDEVTITGTGVQDGQSPQVRRVLAPHESDPSEEERIIDEIMTNARKNTAAKSLVETISQSESNFSQEPSIVSEEKANEIGTSDQNEETAPVAKGHFEDLIEQIVEEESQSTAVTGIQAIVEEDVEPEPSNEIETQHETESKHETVEEQEPVSEPESQEDSPSAENSNDVPAPEAQEDAEQLDDVEQEPVNTSSSETESTSAESKGVEHPAPVEEQVRDASPEDEGEPEPPLGVVPAFKSSDDDEESQLSFDIF